MAVLTNTVVSGNLRSNGLITTDKLYINGLSAMPLNPSSNISGNETSTNLVSAKQVVDYIQANSVTPSKSGGTVSWGTGWVTAGETTVTQSNIQSNQTLSAGGSVTFSAGYLNNAVTVSASSLSSQTSGTAAAGDILSGKTAWVNGSKVTGNIATKTISNITGAKSASYTEGTITDANAIPAGGYLNIPAGYYASGISIALGTLIKDITNDAAAANILSGYKAYTDAGAVIEGTMTDRGAPGNQTISTQGGTYTVNSGYYSSGFTITASLGTGTPGANITSSNVPSGATIDSTKTLAGNYVKIGAGYYASDKYYQAQTLAAQTGVDSGKTAVTSSQMLSGYQGWVNGNKISGNISTIALGAHNLTMTASTANNKRTWTGTKTLDSGYYGTGNSVSAKVELNVVTPSLTGGTLSATNGSGVTLTADSNTGIYISLSRADVAYNGAVEGYISKTSGTTAYSGGSRNYRITAITVPKDIPFSVTTTADTALDTSSNLSIINNSYRRVAITSYENSEVKINGGYTSWGGVTVNGAICGTVTVSTGNPNSLGSKVVTNATTGTLIEANPAFDGGGVTCSSVAGVTMSTDNNTAGVRIKGTRANVLYNGAVDGWVTKSDNATALSTADSSTYRITAINVPKDIPFSIQTTADTALDTSSDLTVTNAAYRRVSIASNSGTVNIASNSGTVLYEGWTISKDSSNNLTFTYSS